MHLAINEIGDEVEGNEVEKILPKPQVLSISDSGDIIMTLTWENGEEQTMSIEEFLELTDLEKKEIEENYKRLGYTLVGDRRIGSDYPEYFKDFHNFNLKLFVGGREMYLKRDQFKADTSDVIFPDREKRELIFVKLNLPEKIAPEVDKEVTSFGGVLKNILANYALTK